MSEAPETEEAPVDNVLADAPEATVQADPAPSAEDRALTMGWTPKGQFKGDPEKWVDAETFVKRGDEFLPFLKANNKRLEREVESLRKAVDRSVQHISKADERAYERAKKELEAQLDQAADAGDRAGVKAVTKDLLELEKERAKPAEPTQNPDAERAVAGFKTQNPWFDTDPVMRAAAVEIGAQLVAEGVVEPTAQLAEIAKRIRTEFPHKFTNPRREQPAAVEGSGLGQRRASKGYVDLPADAKQMCDELVRDKIITREKYTAEYFKDAK